jgi:hypothetical protein
MTYLITSKEELLELLDDFIEEIKIHTGYTSIVSIIENPMVKLLSELTGYQPGYFGKPMNYGEYVVFDVDKIMSIREEIAK